MYARAAGPDVRVFERCLASGTHQLPCRRTWTRDRAPASPDSDLLHHGRCSRALSHGELRACDRGGSGAGALTYFNHREVVPALPDKGVFFGSARAL